MLVAIYRWLVAVLVWLSADPAAIESERPKAAAAVAAARASMLTAAPRPDDPEPKPDADCQDCDGTGYIVHGDGHRTPCPACRPG